MEIRGAIMKISARLAAIIAASLLYTSAASAANAADSVNIYARDGSHLCTATFEIPELKGSESIIKIGTAYLDLKHRRFLQKCKSLETDMALIYEAWKAGAGESDSFSKGPAVGGKSLKNAGNGYSMTTSIAESRTKGTISLITREASVIIGQNKSNIYSATFEVSTGRRLSLADAFGGDKTIADRIAVYLQRYLPASPYKDNLAPDFNAHIYDFCSTAAEDGWYIDGENLIVIYPPASITQNTEGNVFFSVPIKSLDKK